MNDQIRLYAGMLLVSLTTLCLEILQVRLFSVMLWHHLAYMVITVTLLGFGAAGAYVAIRGSGDDETARRRAAWASWLGSLTTLVGFIVVTRIPLDTYMESGSLQLSFIFLYYALLLIPYFFMGLSITLLLSRFTRIVHRLYFFNLVGSALGCVIFLVFLVQLGGEPSVLASTALAALAAALLFRERRSVALAVATAVAMLALLPFSSDLITVRPAPSKALGQFFALTPQLNHESSEWDPVARIDVVSSPEFSKLYRYHEASVDKIFTIDGDAFTFVYRWERHPSEIPLVGKTLYSSAYFFKETPEVAVIGLGGGTDIATALHHRSKKVTGIEINQAMINAADHAFQTYPFHPYRDPSVTIVHEEGRSFLRRWTEKVDILQMSGVDTWSALATGAYVLSENYLYTKEAFNEYYDHLKEDGILCMIRWIFDPPREELRLVTAQSEVLRDRGIGAPWNHFVVIQQGLLAAVVTKMTPFTKRDISGLRRQLIDKPDLKILYVPGEEGTTPFHRYFNALKQNKEDLFISHYPFKIEAVDDDRPFFFEYYRWTDLFKSSFGTGGYLAAARPIGYIILLASLVQAVIFGLIFILLPLWRFRKEGLSLTGAGRMAAYFASLGLAFMFAEVALMQKFVLYLGHPTYSITVTLFALLVFSGLGSYIAGRLKVEPRRLAANAALLAAILIGLYAFLLTPFFNALLGLPFAGRVGVSVLMIAPLGLLMGMPFPTGLSIIQHGAQGFVPWAFGINGVASVTASVLCILLAILAGFKVVLFTAALIYLLAMVLIRRARVDAAPPANE